MYLRPLTSLLFNKISQNVNFLWTSSLINIPPYLLKQRCYCQDKSNSGGGDSDDKSYDPKQDPFFTQELTFGRKANQGAGEPERPYFDPDQENLNIGLVTGTDPPTNCCRSGCANCVWIEYVENLANKYTDPGLSREKILKDLESMDDESIKAFIKLELKSRGLL